MYLLLLAVVCLQDQSPSAHLVSSARLQHTLLDLWDSLHNIIHLTIIISHNYATITSLMHLSMGGSFKKGGGGAAGGESPPPITQE